MTFFERDKNTLSALEAELAFILAREALLQRQADTTYKQAQSKAYQTIRQELEKQLEELQLERDLLLSRKNTSEGN